MSKRTVTLMLIVAGAAVVGWILWRRRQAGAVAGATLPAPTVRPSQIAPQAVVANAFSDLVTLGANWLAQWSREKAAPQPAAAVPYKPPTLTSKGPSTAVPAGGSPNLVTTPGGYFV